MSHYYNSKVVLVLKAARELLSRPNGWTQDHYARVSPYTDGTRIYDPQATCFCVMGALHRVQEFEGPNGTLPRHAGGAAEAALQRVIQAKDIISWNDHPERTQDEVVKAFDQAIEEVQVHL